jgi:hypothetical protein
VRHSLFALTAAVLLTAAAGGAHAQQAVPTTQPTLLTIYVEEIKAGMESAHAAHEAGWPAAFAKAGTPDTYLALESMTGTAQVWFVQPFESYASEGASMARNEGDPVLSAELDRLWRDHGQYLESSRVVNAVARPDLSFGDFPDLTHTRFWDITTFRVRPGADALFEAAARTYGQAAARLAPEMSFRVYQVTAGWPDGTYMVFGSVSDFAEFDDAMARGGTVWEGLTDDEREVFQRYFSEGAQVSVTNRFRLDPGMSYVDEATKAADPDFWARD